MRPLSLPCDKRAFIFMANRSYHKLSDKSQDRRQKRSARVDFRLDMSDDRIYSEIVPGRPNTHFGRNSQMKNSFLGKVL